MKTVSLLGSTGSIGEQALDVIDGQGYKVLAMAAGSQVEKFYRQVLRFRPQVVALYDIPAAEKLKTMLDGFPVRILSGEEGVCACAAMECDMVINAIVGLAGLKPTVTALQNGNDVALANKETLVAGGRLVTALAAKMGRRILPVDSEHSAIFQCLQGMHDKKELQRILLTASGGPFFGKKREELKEVTIEQALNHPNWSMGAKITVDSATMMNKGLEYIEAIWLFDVTPDMVDIVVHRESVVHSMIEYCDNSVIAQLGLADMRLPIQYALTYPARVKSPVPQLDFKQFSRLTFFEPDYDTFGCIDLCRQAIHCGGLFPAGVNSANEEANLLFREGKIRFLDIERLVEKAMGLVPTDKQTYDLSDVFELDRLMRSRVRELANTM